MKARVNTDNPLCSLNCIPEIQLSKAGSDVIAKRTGYPKGLFRKTEEKINQFF